MEKPADPAGCVAAHRRKLNLRLPAAFIGGTEESPRAALGRGLTIEDSRLIIRHYPGDLSERRYDERVPSRANGPESGHMPGEIKRL